MDAMNLLEEGDRIDDEELERFVEVEENLKKTLGIWSQISLPGGFVQNSWTSVELKYLNL